MLFHLAVAERDVPMTIRLLGGEMLRWSDTGGGARPAGGDVFEELLRRIAQSGRVLLAGHHSPQLLEVLLASCDQVTCLVRSLPDATDLEAAHPRSRDRRRRSGPVPRRTHLRPGRGLRRDRAADHAESGELSWSQCLGLFSRLLRPEGQLVVAVENALGSRRAHQAGPQGPGPGSSLAAGRCPDPACRPGRPRDGSAGQRALPPIISTPATRRRNSRWRSSVVGPP